MKTSLQMGQLAGSQDVSMLRIDRMQHAANSKIGNSKRAGRDVRNGYGRAAAICVVVLGMVCAVAGSGCSSGSAGTASTGAPVIAPLALASMALPFGAVGSAYNASLQASGGTAPYTFTLPSGTLPAGIALSATGVLSGAPTSGGIFPLTVKVTDSGSPAQSVVAAFSLGVASVQVKIMANSPVAMVAATAYGIHTSVYDAALDDVAGLPAALATGGIAMLRYPGGVYSDNYHWAQYTVTPFFASTAPACGLIQNGYLAGDTDMGHFLKTLQATNTQAIITINYGSSVANASATKTVGSYGTDTCSEPNTSGQPQEAAAWVAYTNGSVSSTQSIGLDNVGFNWKTVGFWAGLRAASPLAVDDGYNFLRIGQSAPVGVRYWELGNEIFYDGFIANGSFESDLHAPYVYPAGYSGAYSSRANVAALSPAAYGTNAVAFIQAMKAVDATIQVGFDLSSPGVDPIPSTWNPAAMQAVCAGANFNFGILHYYPGTYNAVTAAQLLSLPQSDLPRLVSGVAAQMATYCPSAGAVPIFITETGPNGSYAAGVPAQMNGLYAANVYLAAFAAKAANVDWLELHNGTYLSETNGVETADSAYYGIELAHLFAGPADSLVTTSSSSATVVAYGSAKAGGNFGIFLLNTDPVNVATVEVTASGTALGATAAQYSYGVGTAQTANALSQSSLSITGNNFVVTVPAYTATAIVVP